MRIAVKVGVWNYSHRFYSWNREGVHPPERKGRCHSMAWEVSLMMVTMASASLSPYSSMTTM